MTTLLTKLRALRQELNAILLERDPWLSQRLSSAWPMLLRDLVRSRKLPLVLSLGQHSNDRMTSFYMTTPSGFSMEYGWGGLLVDDAVWRVKHHSTTKLWGHEYMA